MSEGNKAERNEAKLILGEDYGEMSLSEAKKMIENLNKNLKEGEKPWRFATKIEGKDNFKPESETDVEDEEARKFEKALYWTADEGGEDYINTTDSPEGAMKDKRHDVPKFHFVPVRGAE